MIKYNTLRYILEQTSSDLENTVNKLKKLISVYNSSSDEEKDALASDPNSEDGSQFWGSVEKILNDIKDVQSYSKESSDYLKNNQDEVSKSIYDLKAIVETYPEMNNALYKDKFEAISPEVLPPKEETPSAETAPAGEAAPSGEQKPEGEKKSEEGYAKGYGGVSIIDFLDQSGKDSDFESRRKLAVDQGIVSNPEDYKGTASQNTQLLNKLRGGPSTVKASATPETAKAPEAPQIKFGSSKQPVFIDMGGGRYAPASEDQLGDPNVQLYVKNPRKGQGEYLKPNYVKVRREGGELRKQSKFKGPLGSFSNFLGDVGNTLAGKDIGASDYGSEDNGYTDYTQKELEQRKAKREPEPSPSPKKSQTSKSSKSSNYQKNPEGVDSFFK